jgi:translation elongation factor EF-Tu-like GTPase
MSIKLVVLKSGDHVIADVKEIVKEDVIRGILLNKPCRVRAARPMLLTEEESPQDDGDVEITFSPFILLTNDEDVIIPPDWIVSIVNPLDSVVNLYQEKINGQVD